MMNKPRKPRLNPLIPARAKALVASGNGSGSNTFTCTTVNCTYPACSCGLPDPPTNNR